MYAIRSYYAHFGVHDPVLDELGVLTRERGIDGTVVAAEGEASAFAPEIGRSQRTRPCVGKVARGRVGIEEAEEATRLSYNFV